MSVSKFNNEGYYDPVVYEALTKVEAEERAARAAAGHVCLPVRHGLPAASWPASPKGRPVP